MPATSTKSRRRAGTVLRQARIMLSRSCLTKRDLEAVATSAWNAGYDAGYEVGKLDGARVRRRTSKK